MKLQHDSDDCSWFAVGPRVEIDLNKPWNLANEDFISSGRLFGKIIA